MSGHDRIEVIDGVREDIAGLVMALNASLAVMQEKAVRFQQECVELERQVQRSKDRLDQVMQVIHQRRQGELKRIDAELEQQNKQEDLRNANHRS